MSRVALAATLTAVALAIGWVTSPVSVLFGALLVWICWRAGVGLEQPEREWVTRIVTVAVLLRVGLVFALFVFTPANRQLLTLFPDAGFMVGRSIWMRNAWLGIPLGGHQLVWAFNPYGDSSFVYLLAWLQVAVGPAPYALSLISIAAFVGAAALMHRVVHDEFGPVAGGIGLALLLFWPTLFGWSVSVLKESTQLFCASLMIGSVLRARRERVARVRIAWAVAALAALGILATLRSGAVQIAAIGLALSLGLRVLAPRARLAAALLIVALGGAWWQQARILPIVIAAADRHLGHVQTIGVSYRLLDPRFYISGPAVLSSMTLFEAVRFLVNAAIAFVMVPLPWQAGSGLAVALMPQQIVWYAVVLLLPVGCAVGWRRSPWLTCLLAGYALAGLLVIAPSSGNVGTLVRHRDMVVPFALWIGGLGLSQLFKAVPVLRDASA